MASRFHQLVDYRQVTLRCGIDCLLSEIVAQNKTRIHKVHASSARLIRILLQSETSNVTFQPGIEQLAVTLIELLLVKCAMQYIQFRRLLSDVGRARKNSVIST